MLAAKLGLRYGVKWQQLRAILRISATWEDPIHPDVKFPHRMPWLVPLAIVLLHISSVSELGDIVNDARASEEITQTIVVGGGNSRPASSEDNYRLPFSLIFWTRRMSLP
ncbi:hypothetical protein I7I48_04432 [Histoplasma ohiense]|nr:hypothetical protein I7I48_04432 [Histoplasma ohiense (nom. inval.)]